MPDYVGRAITDKIRVHLPDPFTLLVFLRERGDEDDLPCKCCSFDCDEELTVSVSFCGMTVTETIPIPGMIMFPGGQANLPDGSYLIVGAMISCGPCGWYVDIGICAYCDATGQTASDAFTGFVPFADQPTPPNSNTFCPEPGQVTLTCFGDQFGLPCLTNPTASIA